MIPPVLGWILLAAGSPASFDCAKASSRSQKAVCSHPSLAQLDRTLDQIYQKAMGKADAKEQGNLKNAQRIWLSRREACEGVRRCIEEEYRRRITQLQVESGMVPAPAPVGYRCEDGSQMTVFFYNSTAIPAVLIRRGDKQFHLLRTFSGSGAKYHGDDVEFWEHHGEATLLVPGRKHICREQKSTQTER